jgi:uncharacterized membrane protein YfcA
MVVIILLSALTGLALVYLIALLWEALARGTGAPTAEAIALGAVTNFFDTLGIGSFAPTTAWLKLRRMIPDSFLPAVLNAGHAVPSMAQALIFINLIKVDPWLLAACIGSAAVGATVGAPIVVRLPVRVVQAVVGAALLVAALLYALTNLSLMPGGGLALSLPIGFFVLAVAAHFVMGALMTFGIGLFAPSLILLSLLGLDPKAAFPIMMGACAFLMPVSSLRFIRTERIDLRVALGLAIGGVPAVLLAAFVVKSLPLIALRWGVVVVVLYAAAILLAAAARPPREVAVTSA